MLHPAVWPRGAHRGEDGVVRLAGVEVGAAPADRDLADVLPGPHLGRVDLDSGRCAVDFDPALRRIAGSRRLVAQAGAANKAIVREFTATADSTGKIAIQFISNVSSAKVSGIEILPT